MRERVYVCESSERYVEEECVALNQSSGQLKLLNTKKVRVCVRNREGGSECVCV